MQWALDRANEMYQELQVFNKIFVIESSDNWNPFSIAEDDRIEKERQNKILLYKQNNELKDFPKSISWYYAFIGRGEARMRHRYGLFFDNYGHFTIITCRWI